MTDTKETKPPTESPKPPDGPDAKGVRSALHDDAPSKAETPAGKTVTDAGGRDHAVAKESWDKPGQFAVTRDDSGRTSRIEGWIAPTKEKRDSADAQLQRDVAAGGNRPDFQGGHLIAHSLGGPGVEEHGRDKAEANMVPMAGRMNMSYVGNYEKAVREHVKANPDKQFYLQADVHHGVGDAAGIAVTHRLFERDKASGQILKVDGFEQTTHTHAEPAATRASAVRDSAKTSGIKFNSPGQAGCAPGIH